MKYFIPYIILITLILPFSCNDKDNGLLKSHYGSAITLEKTEVEIDIDENTLCSYQVLTAYEEGSHEKLLYAYNGPMHSLDIFDLNKKTISHIKLETEGMNGILKNVSGICVHKKDSIWLYSQGFLYLTGSSGKVNKTLEMPFPEEGFPLVDTNFSMSTSHLFYHPARESIFYLTVTPTEEGADYLVYEYFLKTDTFQTYPLRGGILEKKAGRNFGFMQFPNVTYSETAIIYNFPINSNIYKISIETGKESSFGGQSQYTANMASELSMPYTFQDADKHMIENIHFFEVQYDAGKDVYYRLHLDKANYSTDIKSNQLYSGKEMYLTVFNNRFETIYEGKLEGKTYSYHNSWGIVSNKLFITKDNMLNDNKKPDSFEMDLFETVF